MDGGLWSPGGFLYRLIKMLECRFLADADEIITLTDRARLAVEQWPAIRSPWITVVPTCVDLERFLTPGGSAPPNPSPTFIYSGSVGTWYLLGEMLRFVERAINRFSYARIFILTRNREETSG